MAKPLDAAEFPPTRLQRIAVNAIRPSPYQARRLFDEESLLALAESMKHEGLIQPVTVRRAPESPGPARDPSSRRSDEIFYELISGERRLRAAKILGWKTIEARIILVISEGEAAAKGLIENLQRKDLNPVEEAEGFAHLNAVDPVYWTQERIAAVAGKSRSYVTQSLALLELPPPIQEEVRRETFSRAHALELARLPSPESQLAVAAQIPGRLTREKTRRLVDSIIHQKADAPAALLPDARQPASGDADPLAELWPDFIMNPWVAMPGILRVRYLGGWRWSFEVPGMRPEIAGLSPAEGRVQLRAQLGKLLIRMGRSLSSDGWPMPPASRIPDDLSRPRSNF